MYDLPVRARDGTVDHTEPVLDSVSVGVESVTEGTTDRGSRWAALVRCAPCPSSLFRHAGTR
eukprot:6587022-Prymnesium_polylepis.1